MLVVYWDWHVGGGEHKFLYRLVRMLHLERRRPQEFAYTVCWPFPVFPDRLHYASFFILNVSHPVRLACCDEHVRGPSLDVAVQLVVLLDFEV